MLDNETEISTSIPARETIKPIGPGSRLRKIREARHLTLEEMAKRIRLGRERLAQLENDDYLLMGAPAFAKGYLRAYAGQLGVAKEEILTILQAFDELNLGDNIQHNRPELINEKMDQVSPKTTRWVSYLICIGVLLGVLGYIWHNHTNAPNAANTVEKSAAEPIETPISLPDAVNAQTPVSALPATPSVTTPEKTDLSLPTQQAPSATKTNLSTSVPRVQLNQLEE